MRVGKKTVSIWPFEFKHMSDVVNGRRTAVPGDTVA